jgi:hypothetical protein
MTLEKLRHIGGVCNKYAPTLAYARCGVGFHKKPARLYSDSEYKNAEYELLLRPQTPII